MKFVDMHCDTLMKLFYHDDKEMMNTEYTSVNFERMKRGNQLAQFFAIFIPPRAEFDEKGFSNISDDEYINSLKGILDYNVDKHSDIIAHAYTYEDILTNEKNGKMSSILAIEEGRSVDGKLEKIKKYYDMGVRSLTLTWNFENCFGYPNSFDESLRAKGLKSFGKEAIQYMQELGMLVDVSHLSDGGIFDCLDILDKPFVATHSNARSKTFHPRNLTDDMIRRMGEKGCVSGINFCPAFTTNTDDETKGLAKDYARHARYMADKGGIEFVGLGTDFDGIGGDLELKYSDQMYILENALREVGFSESDMEKIFYKNVLRLLKDSIK